MIHCWEDMQNIHYSDNYHCEHFVCDAYQFLTKKDISHAMLSGQFALPINLRQFKKINSPCQYCFVLFRDENKAHIGIWLDNAVLHLGQDGVVSQSLSVVKQEFKRVDFYQLKQ